MAFNTEPKGETVPTVISSGNKWPPNRHKGIIRARLHWVEDPPFAARENAMRHIPLSLTSSLHVCRPI